MGQTVLKLCFGCHLVVDFLFEGRIIGEEVFLEKLEVGQFGGELAVFDPILLLFILGALELSREGLELRGEEGLFFCHGPEKRLVLVVLLSEECVVFSPEGLGIFRANGKVG